MLPTAFWLSPSNEPLPVPTSHISSVIADPKTFNLTLHEIQEAYKHHGERLGVEGTARAEIIKQLVASGFIRVRRYQRTGYSITVGVLDDDTSARLAEFATKLLGEGVLGMVEPDQFADVTITALVGEVVRMNLSELAAGSEGSSANGRGRIALVESVS